MKGEEIREMVKSAGELQRKGELEKGLEVLRRAEEKIKLLPENEAIESLLGLIRHYEGRTLQAMEEHREADKRYREAYLLRRKNPVQRAYTAFQIFINQDYGEIPISVSEIEATKKDIWEAINAAQEPGQIGDFFQNLAYITQYQKDIKRAIWFYQVAEVFRGIANDERGFVLTWARLGECHVQTGDVEKAREYGEKALKYFEGIPGVREPDPERIKQVKENIFAKIQEKEKK